ncbi:tyrosine-type recombinase/integrase [Novosphingobium album (ex Liu et al. 2023)]|uniref:Integrase arm-type DNA-binding domain-containing protein n=1 Tax=Novosphingobium album (ex Liu et al. 2023) TaxID=3031130 RepID=A0ABT5WM05_9SPHN|nr:integrase arm-type DNA-binding domain-containing protein [Novosphingobium album (ex Liu et al. 2023)]MDE8651062.1 integrase arm-type DNA-binding domain-containing protein [Novosphingobium album (ex Liu et al. 2023)]
MLTELQCRKALPAEKPYKLSDEKGLHLYVTPSGFKSWRYKYRFDRKEKRLTFGPWPEVTLREARARRDDARRLLRDGIDPGAKAAKREVPTLRAVTARWLELQADLWKPKHADYVRKGLEAEILPALGARPIDAITPSDVLELLTAIQTRGATEAAHRLRSQLSHVFQHAIASADATFDPAAALAAALRPIVKRKHPALLDLKKARACLLKVESEPGFPVVKLASRLLALTAARPGMIRYAEPADFEDLDGDNPIWRVPAAKMKLERASSEQAAYDFILPLSRQAVETVRVTAELNKGRKYLFASISKSHLPISENALNVAYRRAGYERLHVPHGWRSTFSTLMNERAMDLDRPGDRAVIDLMLAHQPSGVEAHYNRAGYMPRRRLIAQEWADLLLQGLPCPKSLLIGRRR